jgi:alkyl hydroperoxide reductase subunit AhpC
MNFLHHYILNYCPIDLGRSVDETLRLVKAIQFANEHGEVCPGIRA